MDSGAAHYDAVWFDYGGEWKRHSVRHCKFQPDARFKMVEEEGEEEQMTISRIAHILCFFSLYSQAVRELHREPTYRPAAMPSFSKK